MCQESLKILPLKYWFCWTKCPLQMTDGASVMALVRCGCQLCYILSLFTGTYLFSFLYKWHIPLLVDSCILEPMVSFWGTQRNVLNIILYTKHGKIYIWLFKYYNKMISCDRYILIIRLQHWLNTLLWNYDSANINALIHFQNLIAPFNSSVKRYNNNAHCQEHQSILQYGALRSIYPGCSPHLNAYIP